MKKDKNQLKLKTGKPPFGSRALRAGKDAERLNILPEWPEKYRRNLSTEAIGMKKLEGFKEVDAEKLRRKRAEKERKKRRSKIVYIAVQSVLIAVMTLASFSPGRIGIQPSNHIPEFLQDINIGI